MTALDKAKSATEIISNPTLGLLYPSKPVSICLDLESVRWRLSHGLLEGWGPKKDHSGTLTPAEQHRELELVKLAGLLRLRE